jgi:hypothetical protein
LVPHSLTYFLDAFELNPLRVAKDLVAVVAGPAGLEVFEDFEPTGSEARSGEPKQSLAVQYTAYLRDAID